MKRIIIALILALSLLLSSCDFIAQFTSGKDSEQGDASSNTGDSNGGVDVNSPCPGKPDGDKDTSGGSSGGNNDGEDTDTDGDTADKKPDDDKTDDDFTPHEDEDNNGLCDNCGITVIVEINFLVINDFHGKMSDSDTQPGVDELSLYLRNLKSSHPNSILLSTGDMWQGGAESNLTKGLLVTEWMNELDFAAMTLGNHEYDWGEEYIEANAEAAEFPFLAINIYDRYTDQPVDYCAPSVMVDCGGIQVGIIGAIGDCYSSISSDKCEDVYFKTGNALTALVKAESEKLRSEGADLIVYSIHDGYGSSTSGSISSNGLSGYYDTSLSSGNYVDIVFEGHSHQKYSLVDDWNVYHLQSGGDNSGFTHATVNVNFANGTETTKRASNVSSYTYASLEPDPYIQDLFDEYAEVIAKAYEYLGYNTSYRSSSYLKQLVADLYLELGEKTWGEEYDIVLGGGYLSTRSPYNLYAGDVTYADLMMLFPFDNEITLCSVKGYDLRKKFTETSNSNYYVGYSEYGASIKNRIDDNATYYIIVDSYTAQYKYNNLTVIATYDTKTFARDLLAEYIKSGRLK